jgi:hypothetical protein
LLLLSNICLELGLCINQVAQFLDRQVQLDLPRQADLYNFYQIVDFFVERGHIYSTVDEHHFKATFSWPPQANDDLVPSIFAVAALFESCRIGDTRHVTDILRDRKNESIINYILIDTPLLLASRNGHETLVKLLVDEFKADVNQSNYSGQTPVDVAVENGHACIIRSLVERRADINKTNRLGQTPLYLASQRGDKAMVHLLAGELKADVDQADEDSQNPLYVASWEYISVIEPAQPPVKERAKLEEEKETIAKKAVETEPFDWEGYDEKMEKLADEYVNSLHANYELAPNTTAHLHNRYASVIKCLVVHGASLKKGSILPEDQGMWLKTILREALVQRDGPKLRGRLLELDAKMDLIRPVELWGLISEYAVTTIEDELEKEDKLENHSSDNDMSGL